MRITLNRIGAPAALPLTLDQVKQFARIDEDITEQDATLSGLIRSAVEYFDGRDGCLGRALITQTWRATLDRFPSERFIALPLPPLQSVSSVVYNIDGSPTEETLSPASYVVDTRSEPGRVALRDGYYWPTTAGEVNDVSITFVAGYGATLNDIPERIRQAIAATVAHWYDHRYPASNGAANEVPFYIRALTDNYRMMSF